MNKYNIRLYKSGKFYNAFGDDGLILHELLGYKYIEYKNSVGFPELAINKVKGKLENEKISYSIYEKDNLLEEYKGIDKNYKIVLSKALKNYDIEKRLTRLKSKINNLTIEELERVIDSLEAKSIWITIIF